MSNIIKQNRNRLYSFLCLIASVSGAHHRVIQHISNTLHTQPPSWAQTPMTSCSVCHKVSDGAPAFVSSRWALLWIVTGGYFWAGADEWAGGRGGSRSDEWTEPAKKRRVPTSPVPPRTDTSSEKRSSGIFFFLELLSQDRTGENSDGGGRKDTAEPHVASRCKTKGKKLRDEWWRSIWCSSPPLLLLSFPPTEDPSATNLQPELSLQ